MKNRNVVIIGCASIGKSTLSFIKEHKEDVVVSSEETERGLSINTQPLEIKNYRLSDEDLTYDSNEVVNRRPTTESTIRCFENKIAKRRKKNKNKKTHRRR